MHGPCSAATTPPQPLACDVAQGRRVCLTAAHAEEPGAALQEKTTSLQS